MKIRTAYGKRVKVAHPKSGKSLTEQSHTKACDINNIVAKYTKTGLIDHINNRRGTFGNVSGADYKAAMDLVAEQKSVFYELPARVRDQFDNDPANYLDLVMTDEGVQELENILNPPKETTEEPVEIEPKEAQNGDSESESAVT